MRQGAVIQYPPYGYTIFSNPEPAKSWTPGNMWRISSKQHPGNTVRHLFEAFYAILEIWRFTQLMNWLWHAGFVMVLESQVLRT